MRTFTDCCAERHFQLRRNNTTALWVNEGMVLRVLKDDMKTPLPRTSTFADGQ
jgi:hypothetical protein